MSSSLGDGSTVGSAKSVVPVSLCWLVQGYLAHKKHPPPGNLQYDYTLGLMVVLGGEAVSYERGTHVPDLSTSARRVGNFKAFKELDLKAKPRPESSLDCRICAIFTRQQPAVKQAL